MPALDDLRAATAHVVGASVIPYGYTLTIWSSGALCTGRFGLPSPAEAFGFVGGASVAYCGLALVVRRVASRSRAGQAPRVLWENGVALPALAATYGLSRPIASPGANFFLVPLVATLLYLLGLSLLVSRHHLGRRTTEHEHGTAIIIVARTSRARRRLNATRPTVTRSRRVPADRHIVR